MNQFGTSSFRNGNYNFKLLQKSLLKRKLKVIILLLKFKLRNVISSAILEQNKFCLKVYIQIKYLLIWKKLRDKTKYCYLKSNFVNY